MIKAINIVWDTKNGDKKLLNTLPTEIKIPDDIIEVSDYISDTTGFCALAFDLVDDTN